MKVGEGGFGWDRLLGSSGSCGWKSGCGNGFQWSSGEDCGWHVGRVLFEAREGIKKSGEFVVEFTEERSHGAQDLGLLCEAFLAAWQLSAIIGRLVGGVGIIWTGVLQKKIIE